MSAVDREAEWLKTTGDGLPALLKTAGGPWDVLQGYVTRSQPTKQTAIYLTRRARGEVRFSNQRRITTHDFRLRLWWPIGASTTAVQLWENEQRALDAAVDLIIARIRGTLGDHTHGGRFMSVAEDSSGIQVAFADPDQTLSASPACLRADVTYSADDADFTA